MNNDQNDLNIDGAVKAETEGTNNEEEDGQLPEGHLTRIEEMDEDGVWEKSDTWSIFRREWIQLF